jgi:hypothetical protein
MGRPAVDEEEVQVAGRNANCPHEGKSSDEQWRHMSMQLLSSELQESVGRFQMPSLNAFGQAFRCLFSITSHQSKHNRQEIIRVHVGDCFCGMHAGHTTHRMGSGKQAWSICTAPTTSTRPSPS